MVNLVRTDAVNEDFKELVNQLDTELASRDGEDHAFYSQFNKIAAIRFVIVAYENKKPIGCGAIKEYAPGTVEVKRMFVIPEKRGTGIAPQILASLETWAKEMKVKRCILETGLKEPEAIGLYQKSGYVRIPNYGQYTGVENSLCFEKQIEER